MSNRTNRKEIYFTAGEKAFVKEAMRYTGLDETNCIRLLIKLGWHFLTGAPDVIASNMRCKMKPTSNRQPNG